MPVFPNGELRLRNSSARIGYPPGFHSTVLAAEINNHAVSVSWTVFHFGQSAGCARRTILRGKRIHLYYTRPRAIQLAEFDTEHSLIELLRTRHILHVHLKPPDWV